jgi:hypothetical protein
VTELNKREGSPLILSTALAILALVNIVVFRSHYFGNECFPWDFWKLYYAVIPFWTTSLKLHVFPHWVPFEGMGYPFLLNLQSSFFYPPLWLFVLSGLHYSLHVAVVVQCLHVLWGACGALLLLRVLTNDWRSALFGALAYHFFGGFYSNAEHTDIIRAYAWLPWLFWSATVSGSIRVRNLLLPPIVYCAITASYPGNTMSHLFFLGGYIFFQFFQRSLQSNRKALLILVGLLILGVTISLVALGPAFLLRNELTRANERVAAPPWLFTNWLSVIAPWTIGNKAIFGYFGDPSMISVFVGVPTLALVILIRRGTAKVLGFWWLVLIVALTLAQGRVSMFYRALVAIVPVLGLSRMTPSDYRGLIGLALIVLATGSLGSLLAATQDDRTQLIKRRFKYLCLIPAILMSGFFFVVLPAQELVWILLIWGATVLVLYAQWPGLVRFNWLTAGFLFVLVFAGGWHVVSVSKWTWTSSGEDIDALYKQRIGFATDTTSLPVAERIRGAVTRPARVDRKRADFSWAGYLDGTYQMIDYGNTVLNARAALEKDEVLRNYMLQPLTPLVFQSADSVSLDVVRNRLSQGPVAAKQQWDVIPAEYGVNTIAYKVTLDAESTIVENEIWFPGWKAKLMRGQDVAEQTNAIDVDKTLRAWRVPAGQYRLVTEFKTPHLAACGILSAIGVLIYLAVLLSTLVRPRELNSKRNKQSNMKFNPASSG